MNVSDHAASSFGIMKAALKKWRNILVETAEGLATAQMNGQMKPLSNAHKQKSHPKNFYELDAQLQCSLLQYATRTLRHVKVADKKAQKENYETIADKQNQAKTAALTRAAKYQAEAEA